MPAESPEPRATAPQEDDSAVGLWAMTKCHLTEMEDWASGRKSYVNLADHDRITLADVAVMDAAEVQKHAACAAAYARVARARTSG